MRPVMSVSGTAGGIESVPATCCRRFLTWAKTAPPGSARRRLRRRRGIAPPPVDRPQAWHWHGGDGRTRSADGGSQGVRSDIGRTRSLPRVDAVALASVISSAAVGFAGAGVALYSAHRTAKTAREGRAEQRAADGYLQVLTLVEREGHWIDTRPRTSAIPVRTSNSGGAAPSSTGSRPPSGTGPSAPRHGSSRHSRGTWPAPGTGDRRA
jgi:hypothetical protein